MRLVAGLLLICGLLAPAPVQAQTGLSELHIDPPVPALEAALISAVEGGGSAGFQRLLMTERVYIPITENTYRTLAASQQAGQTPNQATPIEFQTFSVAGGAKSVMFFTSPEALKAVVGDRYWIVAPGARALAMLPADIPLSVMNGQGHQASFTAAEVRMLLAAENAPAR